jgi:VanZ family protein
MMKELKDRFITRQNPRLTASQMRRLIWSMIALAWSPFVALPAIAAILPVATIQDPLNIPPVLMGLAMVISTMAGATSLLMRIDRELSASPDKPLSRPWIMSSSHMFGAWLAGILAFIISRQYQFELWPTLGSVLSASFLGSKALEVMTEKYMSSGFIGKKPDAV